MANIWVRDFNGGLDARRLPETSAGGVLLKARNGHISRGGSFDQRAAFVPEYNLPYDTVGMFHSTESVVVFGSAPAPDMPAGVTYQRLQHPSGQSLVSVPSADLYRGKIYAVGVFSDGSIFHFYDGDRVSDWYDGRALAKFTIDEGADLTAAPAQVVFRVFEGASDPSNEVTSITIGGTPLFASPVPFNSSTAATAADVAAAINGASTRFSAVSAGDQIYIYGADGTVDNGLGAVYRAIEGGSVIERTQTMAGGAVSARARIRDVTVDGVSVIDAPVLWAGTREATAAALANAIATHVSTPDYTATALGADVFVRAVAPGDAANGRPVTVVAERIVVNPIYSAMAGGNGGGDAYQPGTYVQTIGQKMYATSGSVMHFSGIREPMKWTTDAIGAGFIDMSEENSGAEQLRALAKYQSQVAVFAERTIQTWYIDPDPSLNRQTQVLNNTGTASPKSVTAFGDTDIFYLDESGIRSLRARDSSNAAATSDIGIPIDALVTADLAALSEGARNDIIGLIEPVNGRFWLVIRDKAYVFSYFPGSKISAWSEYTMEFTDEDGEQVPFIVTEAMAFKRRVYLRAGNQIFVYSGLTGDVYDETPAEAWTPYLDAGDPTRRKQFTGVDAAVRGEWELSAAWYLGDETAQDKIGRFTQTTYDLNGRVPAMNTATHVALRFKSIGRGPHVLASCVVHFEGKEKAE